MRRSRIFQNTVLFGQILRQAGFQVEPSALADFARGLAVVGFHSRQDVYFTGQAIFVRQAAWLPVYEQAFNFFWNQRIRRYTAVPHTLQPGRQDRRAGDDWSAGLDQGLTKETSPEQAREEKIVTFSDREVLRQKDFAGLLPEEIEIIQREIARIARIRLPARRSRRYQPAHSGRPDFRRSLRKQLGSGGEMLALAYRGRRWKTRPLVVLADVSGSMQPYARILLQFAFALTAGAAVRVESFLFSTRLTRVTDVFSSGDIQLAMREVSRRETDWSGGTRTGEALRLFNQEWGRRVLGSQALVLLISDGWDRGDPESLRQEIARLQRTCYRLIWLNPLLGQEGYRPLTRGMRAALPFVDDFLPVHNLASLEALVDHLANLAPVSVSKKSQSHPLMGLTIPAE